ncbi:glycosyltransferase family 2 protein [Microbacterium karelineae]|uniref:glycosyltransferase family 2 protein n=1 Tax=Microbacterium karelineae TaxID=2654283 RepID=UPI0012E9C445|nr:glycosyltransferase [Microbacterium karelineae]
MPAPVHVVLVARSTPAAASRFERALAALRSQTVPIAGVSVVVCGDPSPLRDAVDASRVDVAVQAPERIPFAGAVELALDRVPDGRAAWLLDDDSAPEPDALARLLAALERQPSVALAAPKLVRAGDRRRIESFGVTMTRSGRSIELARGEYDQGQHDAADDVLGADIRGMLVRADVLHDLVPDRALLGADEGLDMGVRARLGGRRVALAPEARVAVWPSRQHALTRAYTARVARLHRRLAYAPLVALPVQWLLLLPLALWATAISLLAKRPGRVAPEWMAAATVMVRLASIARSRGRLRRFRTGPWRQVDPLRLTRGELREHQQAADDSAVAVRSPLRFFSGGGAWTVLGALVASVAAFVALLTWPAMAGGALLPLRRTVSGLWSDALYGLRPEGVADVGAADPFSAVLALLGTVWPAAPSYALVLLWLLALPLAVAGGWFAATRVADSGAARIGLALMWGAAPPFWDALMQGRPAAVLAHILLPWLVFSAAAAHRSWTTAGAASLLLAGVLACAPSLAPAAVALWLAGIVVAAACARRGIVRVVWLLVPSIAMFAPLASQQLSRGTGWALFADPGATVPFAVADRGALAAGFVDGVAAWARALAEFGIGSAEAPTATWWVPLLLAPAALLALAAPAVRRGGVAVFALAAVPLGVATALLAAQSQLVAAGGAFVPVWPGSALSLAWMGVVLAAAVALEALSSRRRWAGIASLVAIACVVVAVAPQVTALHRGATPLHAGDATTLPAYVTAEARDDLPIGTLVLTPLADGSVATDVVWGASETLSGASTFARSAAEPTEADERLAEVAGDIISGSAVSVTEPLAESGLSFVLLRQDGADPNASQRIMALTAQASMDQRSGFVRVGETPRGVLWRLDQAPAERAQPSGAEATTAWLVTTGQAVILVAALLLAIPTRRTRDEARLVSRRIGPQGEETA